MFEPRELIAQLAAVVALLIAAAMVAVFLIPELLVW